MPFTPFHLGPALFLGGVLRRQLDLPTLLVGSVIVDVRATLVVFGPLDPPVHGILTTFTGGTLVAATLGGAMLGLPRSVRRRLDYGRPADTGSGPPVFAAAFVGVYSHVVLDSLLYADAHPFHPLAWNPFLLDGVKFVPVYAGCVLMGLLGVTLVAIRLRNQHWST